MENGTPTLRLVLILLLKSGQRKLNPIGGFLELLPSLKSFLLYLLEFVQFRCLENWIVSDKVYYKSVRIKVCVSHMVDYHMFLTSILLFIQKYCLLPSIK